MITDILKIVERMKQLTALPFKQICVVLELPYGTVLRWQVRLKRSQPVIRRPGPGKVVPLNVSALQRELQDLKHSSKRTQGTTAVYQRYTPSISRRDFYFMVKQARYDAYTSHRHNLRRITWLAPGLTWAVDDTEYGKPHGMDMVFLHQIQDLASTYKFGPLLGDRVSGEEAAGYLDHLCGTYGAPLFYKRDNAGNLNSGAINEVLDAHMVIPVNSPPYYPPYNGSIEHAQGELKGAMRTRLATKPSCAVPHLETYAESSAHDLNHKPRAGLGGKTACQMFFGQKNQYRFNKRERREIYDLIKVYAERILNQINDQTARSVDAAWRIAVESWLRWKGYIKVSINGKVLPNLSAFVTHN